MAFARWYTECALALLITPRHVGSYPSVRCPVPISHDAQGSWFWPGPTSQVAGRSRLHVGNVKVVALLHCSQPSEASQRDRAQYYMLLTTYTTTPQADTGGPQGLLIFADLIRLVPASSRDVVLGEHVLTLSHAAEHNVGGRC